MPGGDSLWTALSSTPLTTRFIWGAEATVALADLATGSAIGGRYAGLSDRTALIITHDQLAAALALIECDGLARRMLLCPPDLEPMYLPEIIERAGVDVVITDRPDILPAAVRVACVQCTPTITAQQPERAPRNHTEWILFTSGTTGIPKMVVHDLASLTGGIQRSGHLSSPATWATFYDIRRYGGLQILLRALVGGGSLLLTNPHEALPDFLGRVALHGATHVTGTPSHWRRALMTPATRNIHPTYARLSGEIADQGILDHLRGFFPEAKVGHAFASTEAGVAFEVDDGFAGFPARFLESTGTDVELDIRDDTLRVRSRRTARRYLGNDQASLRDPDGFIDTGDVIDQRGGRCYFAGRRGGIINVGGLKVHPEEVEAVINRHARVRMSLVTARKNPVTGSVVVADVVLTTPADEEPTGELEVVKKEILRTCRQLLAPHKVPTTLRIVPTLAVSPAGKILRNA